MYLENVYKKCCLLGYCSFFLQNALCLLIRDTFALLVTKDLACNGTTNHTPNVAKPFTTEDVEELRTDTPAVWNASDLAVASVISTTEIFAQIPFIPLVGFSTNTPAPVTASDLEDAEAEMTITSGLISSANLLADPATTGPLDLYSGLAIWR